MVNPHLFPVVRGAGLLAVIAGVAIVAGGLLGEQRMFYAFAAGMTAGFAALGLFSRRLAGSLGTPTKVHWTVVRTAVALLVALVSIATKVFHDDLLQGQTRSFTLSILFAAAIDLLVLAVAAGPVMLSLAGLCIVNAAIGVFAPVPLIVVWLVDGLLKIGLGIAMLQIRATSAQDTPVPREELRQAVATVRQIMKNNEEWRNSKDPAKGPFTEDAVVREMERSAREAILLRPELLPGAVSTPIRSFFGGLPKLPLHVAWPRDLIFVAQIDLGELPRVSGSPLPASGTLYFFLDVTKEYLEDGDAVVLFHNQPATASTERQSPHGSHESPTIPFRRYPLRFLPFRSHRSWLIDPTANRFPARPYHESHRRLQSQSLATALGSGAGNTEEPAATLNQMLGYGEAVQSTPIDRVDDVLLLQVAPDMYRHFWPDADSYGVIQFWIGSADLAARRFERVSVNFDCT